MVGLGWDEQYRQSDRLALHREVAEAILQKGLGYRDFTPATAESGERGHSEGPWLFNPGMREISPRRATARGQWREVRHPVSRTARRGAGGALF